MRRIRIMLPVLVALAMIASCTEQKPAPEAQEQAAKGQQAPQQTIEAAKDAPKPEPKPEPVAKPEPNREVKKPVRSVPPKDRAITADRGVAKSATDVKATDQAPAEKYVLPELETVELPSFEYPTFAGKKVTIVFTGNVIGELEPCG